MYCLKYSRSVFVGAGVNQNYLQSRDRNKKKRAQKLQEEILYVALGPYSFGFPRPIFSFASRHCQILSTEPTK